LFPPPSVENVDGALLAGVASAPVRYHPSANPTGLRAVYDWYQRNAELAACVLRDAEHHALVKEISALRYGPYYAAFHDVLGAKLGTKQRAMLHLALSYFTWRTLVRESGLKQATAVAAMVDAIEAAQS
jgi:hypothetical protein